MLRYTYVACLFEKLVKASSEKEADRTPVAYILLCRTFVNDIFIKQCYKCCLNIICSVHDVKCNLSNQISMY